MIFLDSAGSSLPPQIVLDTVVSHLRREAEIGGYRAAAERADDLAAVKSSIAELLGATPTSIALSDSATRAWTDFWSAVPLHAGDRVLISEVDYASNAIATLHRARAVGAKVEVMASDDTGRIDLDALAQTLDERVKLVSVVHAPTNGGLVNPAAEVAKLAHQVGALVLLDACQSVGQLPVRIDELEADAISATGRKWLRGPRGTGFLYIRPELINTLRPAVLDNHGAEWTTLEGYVPSTDATRFEFWEHNVAARLGLGAAVRHLLDLGPAEVFAAITARAEYLRAALSALPGVTVQDLGGPLRSGIVSFTVDGVDPAVVRDQLWDNDIAVTVSPRNSTLLDMSRRGLNSVVRASPHSDVSFADLDRTAETVSRVRTMP